MDNEDRNNYIITKEITYEIIQKIVDNIYNITMENKFIFINLLKDKYTDFNFNLTIENLTKQNIQLIIIRLLTKEYEYIEATKLDI